MATMDHPDPAAHLDHPDKTDTQDLPASPVNPDKSWTDPDPLDPPAQLDLKDLPAPMAALDNPASPVTMVVPDQWEMLDTMAVPASQETQEAKDPTETPATRALATTAHHPVPLQDIKRLCDQVDGDSSVLRIATTFLGFLVLQHKKTS
jgi:hypothetical protein